MSGKYRCIWREGREGLAAVSAALTLAVDTMALTDARDETLAVDTMALTDARDETLAVDTMALTDGRVSASLFYLPLFAFLERSGVPRKGLTDGTMSQEAETCRWDVRCRS